jgi:hypothetical protein
MREEVIVNYFIGSKYFARNFVWLRFKPGTSQIQAAPVIPMYDGLPTQEEMLFRAKSILL